MMKTFHKIIRLAFTSIAILMSSICVGAQEFNEEKLIQQRAKERVKLMNDYISYMADKSYQEDSRLFFREKALRLFIGKGYEYEENGVMKQGVMMQTTSVNRSGVVSHKLLIDYFSALIKLRYSNVNVTSTEIAGMKVSDLKKVESSNNRTLYMCTCQYVQYFRGEYGDGRVYMDKTTKRIVCYVEADQTEDGVEYMLLLGDVEAISTERV